MTEYVSKDRKCKNEESKTIQWAISQPEIRV